MHSQLTAAHYCSAEIFELEQARIFRKLWIFVGFRTLLNAPNAFLTHEIGGVPVVVQNTNGELAAFVNRCAHRRAPVQLEDYGQRRLACRYHGWVYGGDGKVRSIPGCAENYGFTDETMATLGMKPIALQCIGNLVFVCIDENPQPIENQFHGSFLKRLEEVSAFLDNEILFAKFTGAYNWKLNFENVNDWNHVPFVHSQSFAPLMPDLHADRGEVSKVSAPPMDHADVPGDIRGLSYETRASFEMTSWPWHESIDRFTQDSAYHNFFIYPNVNFITLAGTTFLAQQFCPASAGTTEVRLSMTSGRKTRKIPAMPAILWGHMKAEKAVIDEDIVVLEALQRGFHQGDASAFHGTYETRLRSIARVYTQLLGEAGA